MKIGRYKRSFKVEPLDNPVPRKEYVAPQPDPRKGPETPPETPRPTRVRATVQT